MKCRRPVLSESHVELIGAAGSWIFCSVGMLVFNKFAVSAFPLPCLLVALQMAFTVFVLLILGWNTLHIGSAYDVLRWSAVAPFFAGVLLTSMFALHHAPLSLVVVFRGLAPIFGLGAEMFYPTPIKVDRDTLLCLVVMLVGVGLYCKDLKDTSHFKAIGWVLLNNLFVVGDRLLQRLMLAKDQWPVDISKTSCTLLNNVFGLIPLLIAAQIVQEYGKAPMVVENLHSAGIMWLTLSCVVGVGIAYAGVWTQSLINATSFLVLATANKFFVLIIEVCFMRSKTLTPFQLVGASLTILAGVYYGKARQALDNQETKAQSAPLLNKDQKLAP